MKIDCDWHIHSHNSCDQAAMMLIDLAAGAQAKGIVDFGITDHVNTPYNLPDLARCRREWAELGPLPHFHFGVEASCVSAWELAQVAAGNVPNPAWGVRRGGPPGAEPAIPITAATKAAYGVEYIVAGVHWPLYVPYEQEAIIRDYHRQYMFLAAHPLVDIVAHPWWWQGHWMETDGKYLTKPWFEDFTVIPQSLHDEFAAAVIEHGKAAEINIYATLHNPFYSDRWKAQYLDYLAYLAARGVTLSIGSDCHWHHYRVDFADIEARLASVGITGPFWRLPAPDRSTSSC